MSAKRRTTRPAPTELDDFLAPFPDDVIEVVHRLRERVLAAAPNAHEVVWDATNAVSLVYTPTERWQDGICHLAVYSQHVNLGFNQGATLPDPDGILEGTGARIRHVRIASATAAGAAWVDRYLAAAMEQAGMQRADGDGASTVRRSAGAKRRPAS